MKCCGLIIIPDFFINHCIYFLKVIFKYLLLCNYVSLVLIVMMIGPISVIKPKYEILKSPPLKPPATVTSFNRHRIGKYIAFRCSLYAGIHKWRRKRNSNNKRKTRHLHRHLRAIRRRRQVRSSRYRRRMRVDSEGSSLILDGPHRPPFRRWPITLFLKSRKPSGFGPFTRSFPARALETIRLN